MTEDRTLRLVKDDEAESLSPSRSFFEKSVKDLMGCVAEQIAFGDMPDEPDYIEIPKDISIEELESILKEKSLVRPELKTAKARDKWLMSKIAVRIVDFYRGKILVARPADVEFPDEPLPRGEELWFESKDFMSLDREADPYDGMRFWQVISKQEADHGETSLELADVKHVKSLIHDLLYDVTLDEVSRSEIAVELRQIRLSVGAPARAVIADYVREYFADGWMDVIADTNGIEAAVVDGGVFRDLAMSRLNVGGVDLRRVGGVGSIFNEG